MRTITKAYYSDKHSEKMLKKRKTDLVMAYTVASSLLTSYSLLMAFLIFKWERITLEELIWTVGLWMVGIIVGIWGINYAFLKDSRQRLKYGISVGKEGLSVFGEEIPISSISRAEIAVDHVFALLPSDRLHYVLKVRYEAIKRGKRELRTLCIRDNETEDLFDLKDSIGKAKGWN